MILRFIPLFLVIVSLGCGSSVKRGTISGKVMIGGQVVKGGTITFQLMPANSETKMEDLPPPVTAMINEDGTYTATDVPFGNLAVGVVPPEPPPAPPKPGEAPAPTGTSMANAKAQLGQLERAGVNVREGEAPREVMVAAGVAPQAPSVNSANTSSRYFDPMTSGITFTLDQAEAVFDVIAQ